jgi:protein-disulfide isomerase
MMATKDSASQKAAAARKAAAALRAKQRAAARRNTILATVGALALVAVFVVIVLFIVNGNSGPNAVYNSGVLKVPSAADETNGILVGPGGVAGGTAPADAVRIDLYEDPYCSGCKYFDLTTSGEIGDLVDQGEVAFFHHPVSFLDNASRFTHYSTRAANAWITVAEYDPEHYWAFVDSSYVNGPDEQKGETRTNDEIAELARGVGVSDEAIAKIADGEFTQWVVAATDLATVEQADAEGQFSTPTLLIEGVRFLYWDTPGNVTAAVAYVKEYGAEAFAEYLASPPEPEPSPSPSPSA